MELVDERLRKNEPDEAIRILDLASTRAAESQKPAVAVELAFRAATLQQQRNNYADAADRFLLLAAAYPDDDRAAESHLAAIWNTAQLVGQKKRPLQQYVDMLGSHLEKWPNSPTTAQAAIWLIPILVRQGQFEQALATATKVSVGSQLFEQAADFARQASLQWLRKASDEDDGPAKLLPGMCDRLTAWIQSESNATTAATRSIVELQLFQLEIQLAYSNPNVDSIGKNLAQVSAAIGQSGSGLGTLGDEARLFLELCSAAQGRDPKIDSGNAKLTLDDLDSAELWMLAWQRLRNSENQARLAGLLISLVEANASTLGKFSDTRQFQWRLAVAESRWRIGQHDQATAEFQNLIAAFPQSLSARTSLARLASESHDASDLELALSTWRTVANGTRPQSDAWYEAKYYVAKLLLQTGQRDEAEKLLRFLKAVPPGWEPSKLKNDFETLLLAVGANGGK